jgi:hypothetical protein
MNLTKEEMKETMEKGGREGGRDRAVDIGGAFARRRRDRPDPTRPVHQNHD